jgi:hypothetical protein
MGCDVVDEVVHSEAPHPNLLLVFIGDKLNKWVMGEMS